MPNIQENEYALCSADGLAKSATQEINHAKNMQVDNIILQTAYGLLYIIKGLTFIIRNDRAMVRAVLIPRIRGKRNIPRKP